MSQNITSVIVTLVTLNSSQSDENFDLILDIVLKDAD